jgi:hypothetical protein
MVVWGERERESRFAIVILSQVTAHVNVEGVGKLDMQSANSGDSLGPPDASTADLEVAETSRPIEAPPGDAPPAHQMNTDGMAKWLAAAAGGLLAYLGIGELTEESNGIPPADGLHDLLTVAAVGALLAALLALSLDPPPEFVLWRGS